MTEKEAIEIILDIEKGYVNDPVDRGGETNYGISKRAYPHLDIKNLTKNQARQIYSRDYWGKYDIDFFHPEIQLQMFDITVNSGFKNAVKILQHALNNMGFDFQGTGNFGNKTKNAVLTVNQFTLRHWIYAERVDFYTDIVDNDPSQMKYYKGWNRRAYKILKRS